MTFKDFIYYIIIGVVTGVITVTILPAIWFQITTGNWSNLFLSINPFYYFVMVVAIVIFIIIIGLILFCRSKKKTSPYSASGSIYGYDTKTEYYPYKKVLWPVDILKNNPIPGARPLIDVRNPLCPDCRTELKISNGFFRDTWKCVDCKFKKKTCDNVSNLKEDVKKIVKAEIEK